MRITIDSEVLEKEGLSIEEFSVLLYYLGGGIGTLNEVLCNLLWERNYLIKTEVGYIINNNMLSTIEGWLGECALPKNSRNRVTILAANMRKIFPEGKKPGTNYYWQDSVPMIAKRLSTFFKNYGDNYSDEAILTATRKYVESFDGDYKFMHLLKYFISKRNPETKEETSELLSYLENAGQEDILSNSWTSSLV